MKYLKLACLVFGLGLLGYILQTADLETVWGHVVQIGWVGMAFVLALQAVAFTTDVTGWNLTFKTLPVNSSWIGRLYLIRMAGEAFNNVTPLGSMGGEPVKAWMLKSHYGVTYPESAVSLVLAKTIIIIALVLFLGIGFALLFPSEELHGSFKIVAAAGLAALSIGIGLFFLVQRFQITSLGGRWLSRTSLGHRIEGVLHLIHEFDERLVQFYTERRLRFGGAFLLAFINWVLGVVEVYVVMGFLGHSISFVDAWIIEALAQLVRSGTFFVPASLGAQEGTFMLVCATMTGNSTLGLALSMVRRFRDIVWILGGLGVWWFHSLRPTLAGEEKEATVNNTPSPR